MSALATRRSALGFSAAAIAAGLASPVLAASPDAALIRICDCLLETQRQIAALFEQRVTMADEERTEAALTAIQAEQDALVIELEHFDAPATMAGLRKMATASLAIHSNKHCDGEISSSCDGHWMAVTILETLVGGHLS